MINSNHGYVSSQESRVDSMVHLMQVRVHLAKVNSSRKERVRGGDLGGVERTYYTSGYFFHFTTSLFYHYFIHYMRKFLWFSFSESTMTKEPGTLFFHIHVHNTYIHTYWISSSRLITLLCQIKHNTKLETLVHQT